MSKVTILLSTYNGEKYLSELLKSLIQQTYKDWICYIHDDGSSDGTVSILHQFSERYIEHFKILDYPSTGGAKENFISLLNYPTTDYIMFCDQDDVWLPTKIKVTLDKMKNIEHSKTQVPTVIFTDLKVVDKNLNTIADSYFSYEHRDPNKIELKNLLQKNIAAGCTMMINKRMLKLAIQNVQLLNLAMHDWGIMLLGCAEGSIGYVQSATIMYRQHENNQVGATQAASYDRLKSLLLGKKIIAIYQSVQLERDFVRRLSENVKKNSQYYSFLQQFSKVLLQNKFHRMKFYLENNLIDLNSMRILRVLFV
ncbi:glycosyltransferase family 2 protein [Lactiplantibacillus plantarum]|uniref:glycosyltransferase family 2 protein n=1 Tax=Lactiplantibacillus plantarum TaxID=1590 RepID=UPI003C1D03EF